MADNGPTLAKLKVLALNIRPLQRKLNALLEAGKGASAYDVWALTVMVAGLAMDISETIVEEIAPSSDVEGIAP